MIIIPSADEQWLSKPSPFWLERLEEKRQAIFEHGVENFHQTPVGVDIDDSCRFRAGGVERAHELARQTWGHLRDRIADKYVNMLSEHWRGDPVITVIDGVRTSKSAIDFCYMLTTIDEFVRFDERRPMLTALEIGAGYGGLASWLLEQHDGQVARYFIIDYAPCVKIQRYYLEPFGQKVQWYGPAKWPALRVSVHWPLDLVISTRAMMEMTMAQVEWYIRQIEASLVPGGVFYLVTREKKETVLDEYPFDPDAWRHVEKRPWPGVGGMVEVVRVRK